MTRVAVVGAGAWGRHLIKNFAHLGALGAIVDTCAETLEPFRHAHPDTPLFPDLDAVLARDFDAVAIATPVSSHVPQAAAALAAGLDVFIEKPMTLCSAEAEQLVAQAAAQQRILMVGHLLLHQPAIAWIRDYMHAGELGEIYGLSHERLGLGRVRPVENVLWDSGIHDLAVLLYLVAEEPQRVQANGRRILQATIEDDVHVHLDFPSGIHASVHSSWLWPETRRRLVVRGSRGMLVYDEVTQQVTLHQRGVSRTLENWDHGSEVVCTGHGEPLRLELEHFLDCIAKRREPLSSGASAVPVIRILEQVSRLLESRA